MLCGPPTTTRKSMQFIRTSQGGESAQWWAWCSFPINIQHLILVTWLSMTGCHSTNKNNLTLLSLIISCVDYTRTLSASCCLESRCQAQCAHSPYNATFIVTKPSVQFKMRCILKYFLCTLCHHAQPFVYNKSIWWKHWWETVHLFMQILEYLHENLSLIGYNF